MKTRLLLLLMCMLLSFSNSALYAQILATPRMVADGPITKLHQSPEMGLLAAGTFRYWGFPARNIAVVDTATAAPLGDFPLLTVSNNAQEREVIPDGNDGWFVSTSRQLYSYGTFQSRARHIWTDGAGRIRTLDCVTHLNGDNTVDTSFVINSPGSAYRIIGIQSLVKYKDVLYGWCDLADADGNFYRRKLLGISAKTGQVVWDDQNNHRIDVATGQMIVSGSTLFVVGQMNVVRGQPTQRFSISYDLETKQLGTWNVLSAETAEYSGWAAKITGYEGRILITVDKGTSIRELVCTDASARILWRLQPEGFSHLGTDMTIDGSVGYYAGSTSYTTEFVRFSMDDGRILKRISYPVHPSQTDTSAIYVGTIKRMFLRGGSLYVIGFGSEGGSLGRHAIKVDTATFRPSQWLPFGGREDGESENNGYQRYVETLAFQNGQVFVAGTFNLVKLRFAPGLAAIDPITSTLRWKPNADIRDVNYLQQISEIAAEGDSMVWIVQNNTRILGFDGRTGFKRKDFEFFSPGFPVTINKIIPAADRLYLQGFFYQLKGITVANGFGAITKEGTPYVWEPVFANESGGQVNHISLQGSQILLGGSFVARNGSRNLALVDRFTGALAEWKAEMPNSSDGYGYDIKRFVVQGNEVFTLRADIGYNRPGEYRRVSLTTGKVLGTYLYPMCQAADQILVRNKYIFINERYCTPYERESVSYFNYQTKRFSGRALLPSFTLEFTNEGQRTYFADPADMQFVGNSLYLANRYNNLDGTTGIFSALVRMDFPADFFEQSTEYFPRSGGNAGAVTINFYGKGINTGSKVRLVRTGQPDIEAIDARFVYPDAFRMEASFDLRGKVLGQWDIVITAADGQASVIPGGFVVNAAKPAKMQIMVNAPLAYRTGGPTKVVFSVANAGDKDAWAVPVFIITSPNVKTKVLNRVVINGVSTYRDSAFQFNVNERGTLEKGMWLQIARLSPGQIFKIPLTLFDATGQDMVVRAYVGNPLTDLKPEYSSGRQPVSSSLRTAYVDPFNDIDPERYNTGKLLKPAIDCAFDVIGGFTPTPIDDVIFDGLRGRVNPSDIGGAIKEIYKDKGSWTDLLGVVLNFDDPEQQLDPEMPDSCDPFKPDKKNPSEANIPSIKPSDPNDIVGLAGVKSERYVSGKEPFIYRTRYENLSNATASAQRVWVLDTLDKTKFEFGSFQLNSFQVADFIFPVPPGLKEYSIDVDLRPSHNLVLRMQAHFDVSTGILTTTYTSLDPVTMELTEDVFAGFLPPNQNPPQGEGSISYSVNVKQDLAHLTKVTNTAMIYFDYNEPVATPPWTNTLDKALPESSIASLPALTGKNTFPLKLSGQDAHSGIRSYDIFVSVNNFPYRPFLVSTTQTEVEFTGKADSTYSFYSVATDMVGNQEEPPATFDARTKISSDPLPVKLVVFDARKEQNRALLEWKTSEEVNFGFFEVEASADSKTWNTIGSVPSKGEKTGSTSYSFADTQQRYGMHYFRLKCVDLDGTYQYSKIRPVQFAPRPGRVYPNPVRDFLTIEDVDFTRLNSLQILTADGKMVVRFERSERVLDLHSLPSGVYLVKLGFSDATEQAFTIVKY